ncbi:MAG TPA: sulfatase [Planctomycetaceae bacterium]|nr:sulfatase [Planctomycetaceae bacterium]
MPSLPRAVSLFVISLGLLLSNELRAADAQAKKPPRNVVLMVADDMGLEAGCYGNPVIKTPNIDALAVAGTRFTHAFCTTSSCSPSRSVLLTGLHNHANGQYGLQHSVHNFGSYSTIRSLPGLLAEAGYRTCSIGKFHVQPAETYRFEKFANDGIQAARNSVRMAENAEAFIREADDRPFFIYYCSTDPHRNFANDKKYPGVTPIKYDPQQVIVPEYLPDQPEVRAELAEYYEAISRLDQGVGRMVQALKNTGHWDDTLVIFLSDNGMPFPGAKTTLYESGTRLPLIVRSPGQKPEQLTNAMVTWADITPTILAYTGAARPKYKLHGRSVLPVLEQASPEGWDQIHGSHTFHEVTMYYPMRSIRTRKYHCIMNIAHELSYPFASDLWESAMWQGVLRRNDSRIGVRSTETFLHRPKYELYDVEQDPNEAHNLANSPEHAEILAKFQQQLREWQAETKDPWLVKYEHE